MFKKLMKQVEKQTKKITKQIQRPFQYAQKAGQSQTHQLNREQIGMQITGCQTGIKLQDCQTIQISNFTSHLQSKQLPATALFFFKNMKNVQVGKRDQKDFVLRIQTAFLQSIGMAVKRENQTTIKVAIVWKTYTVNYTEPKTKINYRTSQYGLGWRDSTDHSSTITKQLTDIELQQLRNRLQSQAEKLNAATDANAMLD